MLLQNARVRDTLTLWHLIPQLDGDDRTRVIDRLVKLGGPPPGVDGVAKAKRNDRETMTAWWNELKMKW